MDNHALCVKYPWLCVAPTVAKNIIETLFKKEEHYAGSWQKRGGIGAFMMMCRKWDRIEKIASENHYDIFTVLEENKADTVDDVDDLIGYLLMIRGKTDPDLKPIVPEDDRSVGQASGSGFWLQLPWQVADTEGHRGPVCVQIPADSAHMLLKIGIVKAAQYGKSAQLLTPIREPDVTEYQ
jgi:hypothetical protein